MRKHAKRVLCLLAAALMLLTALRCAGEHQCLAAARAAAAA